MDAEIRMGVLSTNISCPAARISSDLNLLYASNVITIANFIENNRKIAHGNVKDPQDRSHYFGSRIGTRDDRSARNRNCRVRAARQSSFDPGQQGADAEDF